MLELLSQPGCWCAQAVIMQRKAQEMRAVLEGQLSSGWQKFQDVVTVLIAAGALAPGTLKVADRNIPNCFGAKIQNCRQQLLCKI